MQPGLLFANLRAPHEPLFVERSFLRQPVAVAILTL